MFRGKLYPNSRDGSRQGPKSKKDFLNPYQREELKKRLVEKYTKLYALNNPAMVKDEVENFFRQNNEINSNNLLTLEQRIKGQSLKGRSVAHAPNRTEVSQRLDRQGASGKQPQFNYDSAPSGVQGAPGQSGPHFGGVHESVPMGGTGNNFRSGRECDDHSMPPIGQSTLDHQKLSQNQDIQYANEEEEWGTVYKYNHYLYKQEEKLRKAREQQKKQAVRKELDEQLKEKDRREKVTKEKEQSYINAQKQQLEIETKKEEARRNLLDEKTKFEKDMRDMQMKDINERRQFENQQEKALDTYLLQKIKEEMKKEQEDAQQAKARKMNEMRRVMQENEDHKKILAAQAEKEKKDEVELNKKAIQLALDLEEARAAEFKAKADRISNILKNSEDKVNDIKRKNLEMDMRNQRYQQLRDKALSEKEKREVEENKKRKTQLKQFLDKQVDQKKEKEADEKARNDEQAVVWKTDNEHYDQFMADRNEKKKATMDQYKNELKDQMNNREEKVREMASLKMTANEVAMNKLLLNKIRGLKIDEAYVKDLKRPAPVINNIY